MANLCEAVRTTQYRRVTENSKLLRILDGVAHIPKSRLEFAYFGKGKNRGQGKTYVCKRVTSLFRVSAKSSFSFRAASHAEEPAAIAISTCILVPSSAREVSGVESALDTTFNN